MNLDFNNEKQLDNFGIDLMKCFKTIKKKIDFIEDCFKNGDLEQKQYAAMLGGHYVHALSEVEDMIEEAMEESDG